MALFRTGLYGSQLFAPNLFAGEQAPPEVPIEIDTGGGGIGTYYRRPWRVRRTTKLEPELEDRIAQLLEEDEIILTILINAVTRNML